MIVGPIFRLGCRIASYFLYAVMILSAYSGRFNPDYFTYPGLLVLFLPYLAVATFIVALIWILSRRYITGAIGLFALAAAWTPVSNAVPISFSSKPDPDATTFTVMTYNIIHGWDQQQSKFVDDPMKQVGNPAFVYVINSDADIVCLQEVLRFEDWEIPNLTQEMKDTLYKVYPYHDGTKISDTKVLSKYPMEFIPSEDIIKDERLDRRAFTFYKININGHKLTLVNMHLASARLTENERNVVTDINSVSTAKSSLSRVKGEIGHKLGESARYRKIDAEILRNALNDIEGPLLICGDMNDVPESYTYRLLRGDDLHDAYVDTGFGPMVTYNQHMFLFHLDQVFYKGGLKALSVKKENIKYSDHFPLIATFEFGEK